MISLAVRPGLLAWPVRRPAWVTRVTRGRRGCGSLRRVKPHEAPEGARVVPVVQLRQVALLVQEVQEVLAVLVVRVTRARGLVRMRMGAAVAAEGLMGLV